MICPSCGDELPPGVERCENCSFAVAADDPQEEVRTQIAASVDRQEVIVTRIGEATAPVEMKDFGLPESSISRGLEDYLLALRRQLQRLGTVGRLSVLCHCLVVFGAVAPWYHVPHEGYVPGLESWGGVPILLSCAAIACLFWRYRPAPRHRVAPVLFHLVLAVALVLFLLWRFRVIVDTPAYFRPNLAFGYYLTAGGALGATLGAFLGLKDLR